MPDTQYPGDGAGDAKSERQDNGCKPRSGQVFTLWLTFGHMLVSLVETLRKTGVILLFEEWIARGHLLEALEPGQGLFPLFIISVPGELCPVLLCVPAQFFPIPVCIVPLGVPGIPDFHDEFV